MTPRIILLRSDAFTHDRWLSIEEPESGPVLVTLHESSRDGYDTHERVISLADALAYEQQAVQS